MLSKDGDRFLLRFAVRVNCDRFGDFLEDVLFYSLGYDVEFTFLDRQVGGRTFRYVE